MSVRTKNKTAGGNGQSAEMRARLMALIADWPTHKLTMLTIIARDLIAPTADQ